MKIRQILIIVCSILLVSIVCSVGYVSYEAGISFGEKNAEEIRLKRIKTDFKDSTILKFVNTEIVTIDTIPFTIYGSGRVISSSNINVTSEVQGKLSSNIKLKKGTEFSKGQLLFRVQDSDAKMLLIARKSNYLNLVSNALPDLKIDFNSVFTKWESFFNSIKVDSPLPEFPNFNTNKEKNFIVSRSILAEYYNIKSDEERLKKYIINAPFDGSILEAFTDEGAIVNPGTPIVNIIRKGDMEIEIPVNPKYLGKISKGLSVVFNENGNSYQGTVSRIGKFVNQRTQNISVFAKLPSNSKILLNGMYLEAKIFCKGFESVVEIPRKAIFGDNIIYTVSKDSLLIPRKIIVKSMQKNSVIASGLQNNTRIVVDPVVNAKDSMKVAPIF